jgi:drug/metabolite transporter (DMT)-like permease
MISQKLKDVSALPIITLLFLSLIWGSSFILMKKGLEVFNPVQVGTLRIVFACLVMLPIALPKFKTIYIHNWKKFLLFGIIANLSPAILFAISETGLSSSLAGILNSLTPIFTLIIGALVFKTGINKGQTVGLIIGFVGSIALSFIGSQGELGSFNYYALFVIVATICYGIAANMIRAYFMEINSVVLTSLAMFSIGPIAAIYLFSSDFLHRLVYVPGGWASAGYIFLLGVVGTAFALALFNKVIQETSAVFASTVTYLIPIAAVMWGLLDGETLFFLHFVGMGLIIVGVYIINKNK